ncbi:ATP-grasp domain-containing protein [Agrilactobacillus yilanensis]|uniref:ATP-grasp domain-containing protein n=1 Tax=Agrilactobacillus yilanensis TaxID=2485997 RepID=A0ABW4JB79_9LACO|nr:ATP-grasp domain-containing protein [Agrilactobacillus yilanensis]
MAFIYPRQTIGIIGGGMKSYALALTAKKMGFSVALMTDRQEPVLNIVDFPTVGDLEATEAVLDFTAGLPLVMFQDENINFQVLEALQNQTFLPQGSDILAITQDRYLEKTFLDDLNVNVAPYTTVVNLDDVRAGLASIGYPAVIKPIQKGLAHNRQEVLYRDEDIAYRTHFLEDTSAILESWVPVSQEFLIMVCKDQDQKIQLLPIIETFYDGHQLIAAMVAPRLATEVQTEIQRVAQRIAETVNYCGLFGVSFLLTATGNLYAQRIFPGTHTAADIYEQTTGVSQYELQLRTLLGWPLPKVTLQTNGALLMMLKIMEEASYTQIKIKPEWQFNYYPAAIANSVAEPIGEIFVTDDDRANLINRINATDLWYL